MSHLGPMMPPEPIERTLYAWLRHKSRYMHDEHTIFTECGIYLQEPWEPDTLGAKVLPCDECFPE